MPWMSTPREMLTWTSSAPSPPAQSTIADTRSSVTRFATIRPPVCRLARQVSRIASRWPPLPPRKTASGAGSREDGRRLAANDAHADPTAHGSQVLLQQLDLFGRPLYGDDGYARDQAGRFDRERPEPAPTSQSTSPSRSPSLLNLIARTSGLVIMLRRCEKQDSGRPKRR